MVTPKESSKVKKSAGPIEKVTGFDLAILHAPFVLRCSALAIDYIVLILVPAAGMIFNRFLGGAATQGNVVSSTTVWFFAVLLELCNVVALPAMSGQTLGMMLSGIRIVKTDGREASLSSILIRNTLGYLLTVLTGGLGFFLSAVNRSGRALHDLIGGTVVVNAVRRRKILT